MDGEIIDALLALLDQRVLVALPVEFDRIAVDLLQRLVDRHGADRDRRIAQNPFAGVVDVAPGGEVHHRVGAPADCPHHFLDFFLHRRRDGGIADIGIDFREKVAPDRHRLEFAVVDVGRDDGAAARHLVAHEFWRDEERHRGAKAFAVVMAFLRDVEHLFAPEIFALGDVDHFLGDDALFRPFELRDGRIARAAQRLWRIREIARQMFSGDVAVVDRLDRAALVFLDATALLHPCGAGALQALLDVDGDIVVGIDAGRIVNPHRLLAGTLRQRNLAQRHAQIRRRLRRRIDLAGAGNRAGRDLRRCEFGFGERLIHRCTPMRSRGGANRDAGGFQGAGVGRSFRPFAGMTRIRFKGFFSALSGTPRNTPLK